VGTDGLEEEVVGKFSQPRELSVFLFLVSQIQMWLELVERFSTISPLDPASLSPTNITGRATSVRPRSPKKGFMHPHGCLCMMT
jgi:hypothetical protein